MKVSRKRVIAAEPAAVWKLVSDPHSIPRWWPRAMRVEDVRSVRSTVVHSSWRAERGRGVRADYRCTASTAERRYAWEQEVAGTPFERILRSSKLEIGLDGDAGGTRVTLTSEENLRGLSRLGAGMMRGATRRRLDEALDGIGRALTRSEDE